MTKQAVPPQPKRFSLGECAPTLVNLRRRIADVQELIDQKVHHEDQRVDAVETNVRSTIALYFGADSLEFDRYRYFKVNRVMPVATSQLMRARYGIARVTDMLPKAKKGYEDAITDLKGLEKLVEEQRADLSGGTAGTIHANVGHVWHQRIAAVALDLFLDGHYRQAVADGFLALRDMVREKSGLTHLDGAPLMNQAFAKVGPLIASHDSAEQQGAMFLFAGAASRLRNPRAHNLEADTADEAREVLGFFSYLAREVDAANKV